MINCMTNLILVTAIWMTFISSSTGQACYDAPTSCSNSWNWSPAHCDPSLRITLPDIYTNYCYPNDIILWRNGIADSAPASDRMIDYNFIICQEASFASCGYVPLHDAESSQCGQVISNSGIIIGTGIDLTHKNNQTLLTLGASTETLKTLSPFYGLTGSIAAETICNAPFTIDNTSDVYHLTLRFMDQYVAQVRQWYNTQRHDDTLPFMELPLGIRTVMTSIHWKWGHYSSYVPFWTHIISNNFPSAIRVLRSWYSNGATDKRLSAEANVMEASLGCITASNNVDVVFLLDSSGSVDRDDFELALDWIVDFISYFDESSLKSQAVRFGVALFSSGYTDYIYLDEYTSFDEYKTHILHNISYAGGSTYLGKALNQIGIKQFTTANGMRESSHGVARLLIVLTDGKSSDDVGEGILSLNSLNLNVIAIGIASYDINQLEEITIPDNIYAIDTYTDLSTILSGIMIKSCHIPTQLNTENNAIVQDIVIQKYETQYFEIDASDQSKNIVLNITQTVGCIYIYVSDSVEYPSYFEHDVGYTSCSQTIKQIILASNTTNIFISIEGRDDTDAIYDMDVGECNKTLCDIGSNYNPSLDTDTPYSSDPISSCHDQYCNALDNTLNLEITFSFGDAVVYNVQNMECFLYDTIQTLIGYSFGPCNIKVDRVSGGQMDALCQYPPCLWIDKSGATSRRRFGIDVSSQCFDANITIDVYTNSIQMYQNIQQLMTNLTDYVTDSFSSSFDMCVDVQIIDHLLHELPSETVTDQQIYAEIPQPEVTKTPIFVVSMLFGIVIFIWASLHFLCSGVEMCKQRGVGDLSDVKTGIWWPGRSMFMCVVSAIFMVFELVDFILDLVTMIGIFTKSADPNVDSSLYVSCGVASLFAFIASVLLYIGKVQLWKIFYNSINVWRAEKNDNQRKMETMKAGNQPDTSSEYGKSWRSYYNRQRDIGEYLGHLIMYDLFGVALEDCIQITVTWYLKNELLLSGSSQNSFLVSWLWLTFIASIVSVSVKVFRALSLELGCHHDSYRADLKPKHLHGLIKDPQPFYIDSTVPLVVGIRAFTKQPTTAAAQGNGVGDTAIQYTQLPHSDGEEDDTKMQQIDVTVVGANNRNIAIEEDEKYDSFSNKLKRLDESLYRVMNRNEWKPIVDTVHTKYKRYIFEWALEQLGSEDYESVINENKQRAVDEVAARENRRIVDDMKEREDGIDATKLWESSRISQQDLYSKLIEIYSKLYAQKVEHGEDEEAQQNENIDELLGQSDAKYQDEDEIDAVVDDDVKWFCDEIRKSDVLYNQMKKNEWVQIADEIQNIYEEYMLEWILNMLRENEEIRKTQQHRAMNEVAEEENERIVNELGQKGIGLTFDETNLNDNKISPLELYPILKSFQNKLHGH
eukprot:66573_1